MKRLSVGDQAPDFLLADSKGIKYSLVDLFPKQNLLLVFNIGFA